MKRIIILLSLLCCFVLVNTTFSQNNQSSKEEKGTPAQQKILIKDGKIVEIEDLSQVNETDAGTTTSEMPSDSASIPVVMPSDLTTDEAKADGVTPVVFEMKTSEMDTIEAKAAGLTVTVPQVKQSDLTTSEAQKELGNTNFMQVKSSTTDSTGIEATNKVQQSTNEKEEK